MSLSLVSRLYVVRVRVCPSEIVIRLAAKSGASFTGVTVNESVPVADSTPSETENVKYSAVLSAPP